MILVSIKEVKPGMILSQDVIDINSGVTVLASGTVLNKTKIKHLRNLGVEKLKVLKVEEEKETMDLFTEKQVALVNKTKDVFNDIKIGKKILVSEVNEEVDSLLLDLGQSSNILSKVRQIKDIDDYTFVHSINVSMLASMIGKWLGYSKVEIKQLAMAGLFHDIGKMKISNRIINKPDLLNDKELEIIKKHPVYGYNMLKDTIGISKNITLGVLQHHEREDGTGYPLKLKGDKIHEFGKILAICDIFDAMTSVRVYRDKTSPFKVAELIANNSFGKLDARIALTFLNNISKFYVGNIVKLSNGKMGEIIYLNKQQPTRPVVKTSDDEYINLLDFPKIEIVDIID